MNTVKPQAKPNAAQKAVEKPAKAGLETPVKVSFKEDPVLGDYMNIAIHNCKEPYPMAEFVISHHIGKTNNTSLSESWVINRRKDVTDLIRGARDPSKSRIQVQQKDVEIQCLVKAGLLEKVGESFVITKKCSIKLSGHEYDHYMDRSNAAFQAAKKTASDKHQEEQAKKQLRFRRRFNFDKIPSDFLTDDERLCLSTIQAEKLRPEVQIEIRKLENTGYETLINGEYPQKPLCLGEVELKNLKLADIAHNMDKYLFGVLTPQKAGATAPAKASELDTAIKVRDKYADELREAKANLASVHKYYESTTLMTEKNEKIQNLEIEVKDLKDQLDKLEKELEEPWQDRFHYLAAELEKLADPNKIKEVKEMITYAGNVTFQL